jgi:hypothetical protein
MKSWGFMALAVLAITSWFPPAAIANDDIGSRNFEITPFAGYTWGGQFSDAVTGTNLNIREAANYGLMLDFKQEEQNWIELYFSHQPTRLRPDRGAFTGNPAFNLDIDYYHIGGTHGWEGERVMPFIAGTLGVTHMTPDGPGLDPVTKFSISFGGGMKLYATDRIGFRLEGRWFGTLFNGSGSVFCASGGGAVCAINVQGDLFSQFVANAGLILAF